MTAGTASQEAFQVVTPAEAGVQKSIKRLDSRLRGNDRKRRLLAFEKAQGFIQEEVRTNECRT